MENKRENHRRGIDMLHGSIADKLFLFAMPIGLMGLFEQLFNSADVFLLGHFVGKSAMAAVGNNMPVIGMMVMLLMGISLGANVTIAQYLGAKHDEKVSETVQTAIILSVALGALLTVIGELIVYPVFLILEVPLDVYDMAERYLRIFLLGLPFLSLYNFEAAIFRSCGDSKTPLYSLIIANGVNIVLGFLSVAVFDFGVVGIAWATVIAYVANSLILLVLLCRTPDRIRVNLRDLHFSKDELGRIIRIGLPAGIQGMSFALSNVLIQSAINSLGTEAMAASAAGFIIEANTYCFVNGFSQATTTFVGQNYGARNLRRCFRITKVTFGVEAAFLFVVTAVILFFSPELIGLFNSDASVVALGTTRLFFVLGTFYLNGMIDILSGSLRGYGYSLPPAIVALIGICGVRIVWLYTAFAAKPDFSILMATYPISWLFTICVLAVVYQMCRKHIVAGFAHREA